MSRFNWWRRSRKQKPLQKKEALKNKSFLLQQIEHGDYNYSDYFNQANFELSLCEKEKQKLEASWVGYSDSLKYALLDVEKRYRKRYNKLMEDHIKEENRLLFNLQQSLLREFKVDLWEESLELSKDCDILGFYQNYKLLAREYYAQKN